MLAEKIPIKHLEKLSFKRVIQILRNHEQSTEWQIAVDWFSTEKFKAKSRFEKKGQRLVNTEWIDEHASGQSDELSDALSMLF